MKSVEKTVKMRQHVVLRIPILRVFLMINAENAKTDGLKHRGLKRLFLTLLFLFSAPAAMIIADTNHAHACCVGCRDGSEAEDQVEENHEDLRTRVKDEFDADLEAFEEWLMYTFFYEEVVPATANMINQLTTVAMNYTQIIGTFFDAQTQLDTQRVLRELQYEAHKDYVPSQTFCYFGTNTRSLGATEERGRANALALSKMSLDRQMGTTGMAGSISVSGDYKARWNQFIKTYCDPLQNNFIDYVGIEARGDTAAADKSPLDLGNAATGHPRTGLVLACNHAGSTGSPIFNAAVDIISGENIGAKDANRFNRDINYTRLIEKPKTLDINLLNGTWLDTIIGGLAGNLPGPLTPDELSNRALDSTIDPAASEYGSGGIKQPGEEEDILAMSRNLYGHKVLSRRLMAGALSGEGGKRMFMMLRSVAAKRNVAQASFNAIVALKSAGTTHEMQGTVGKPIIDQNGDEDTRDVELENLQTRRFMAAIMDELLPGNPEDTAANIFSLIGYSPSYFAQLEVLAKRIYQNPTFYSDLYETPANVARKKVAMKAIELMVDRAIYESQIRREMSVSVLLASKLRAEHRAANRGAALAVGQ